MISDREPHVPVASVIGDRVRNKGEVLMSLPQLDADRPFMCDGGLETTLVFQHAIDLPDFAAFPLLDSTTGCDALRRYYRPYLDISDRAGTGMLLDTPTWRANLDWGVRAGYDAIALADVNRRAVEFVAELAAEQPSLPVVLNGVIGPRGDGYVVGSAMAPMEAAAYHGLQTRAFAEAGAHMVSAITMTYADEAIGVTTAAITAGMPVVISFTVETDGRLPSGQRLANAIQQVDDATGAAPVYYMINCAHPTHFMSALETDGAWIRRIRGVRANASTLSHTELDAATELDRGDMDELARLYRDIGNRLSLCVVGGCCGTDHEHVEAIVTGLAAGRDVDG